MKTMTTNEGYLQMNDPLIAKMVTCSDGIVNEFGNKVYRGHKVGERYFYDFGACTRDKGWAQYDTTQDASYFGVWVNIEQRAVFTFAEGDISLVLCPTRKSFKAELEHMAFFYGEPPPAFMAYSENDGVVTRTEVYDTRPSVDLDQ